MSSARGDDVDQAGGPDDHLADLPPVEEPAGVLRSQGELATGGLVGSGVHRETVPDLPVDLDDQGYPLLAGEFGVERRPRGDVDARRVPQCLSPHLLREEGCEGPQHLRQGRCRVASALARVQGRTDRVFFFLMLRQPPISTLFPYTTLFR